MSQAPATMSSREKQASACDDVNSSAPHQSLAALLQRSIWLRVRRRRAWLEALRNESVSTDSEAFFMDPDDPTLEQRWQEEGAGRVWQTPITRLDEELAGPTGKPIQVLARTFGLSRAETDLMATCVVQQLDPALAPALAYLNGQTHSAFVSGPVVARLFGHRSQIFWHPLTNLRRWKLVRAREVAPGEATAFEADPMLVPWLEGDFIIDADLASIVRRVPLHSPLAGWPVDEAVRILEQTSIQGNALRLVVVGPPASGKSTFAAVAAHRLGLPCIAVDTHSISEADWEDVFLKVQRFAILGGFAVIWTAPHAGRRWPRHIETSVVQIVTTRPGSDIAVPCWSDVHVELASPSISEKRALWEKTCSGFEQWLDEEQRVLARRYQLSVGQIVTIGRMAPESGAHAIDLARKLTRTDIGNLGQFLPCPFTWDDMVLPDLLLGCLKDLTYEAAIRAEFWEDPAARRLFPRGRGLTALLCGSPGTGKTMAAQVIAAELQMDLFRIDLARVVSKYIGETAKHLSEVFANASQMSAILLFDEADALFAKRTQVKDAHDRYANADTSYLLQLLEEFQGLALLTTNRRGNIDAAFYRRLRYVYEFPKPGPADRLIIWERLTAGLYGKSVLTSLHDALKVLAGSVEVSPAQIKNTLLATAFIARRRGDDINSTDLLKALERELAKEGRALDDHVRLSLK